MKPIEYDNSKHQWGYSNNKLTDNENLKYQ